MPNKPRPENPARQIRVEDDLWHAAAAACAELGTTRSDVVRAALVRTVRRAERARRLEGAGK